LRRSTNCRRRDNSIERNAKPTRILRVGLIQRRKSSGVRSRGRLCRRLRSFFNGGWRSIAAGRRAVNGSPGLTAGTARRSAAASATRRGAAGAAARSAVARALDRSRLAAGRRRSALAERSGLARSTARLAATGLTMADLLRVTPRTACTAFVVVVIVGARRLGSQDGEHGRQHGSRQQSMQHGLTPWLKRLGCVEDDCRAAVPSRSASAQFP
jgi:hypothetical protein